jgi:hypothetical protein
MTKAVAADLERLICALADIASDEASGDGWRKRKAKRLYDEMRLKYPIDAIDAVEPEKQP